MGKKKYKKEILNALKTFGKAEHKILESMTQLMFLKEMKKSGVKFKKGDTVSFKDDIFDYSEDKNVRKIAKLRKQMLKAMNKLVQKNKFKDKELEFLA